jgi:small conductance mechanosensitive channel
MSATPSAESAFDAVALLIKLGLIVACVFLASRVAAVLIGRIERAIRRDGSGPPEEREKRARTVGSVLRGAAWMLILVVAGLMGVRELGLDISPALAAAGGFGVAAGLGAQALVRDWIAGLFVVLENQFGVGDVVRAAGVSGRVEAFALRHTEVRDGDGSVHYVPNGEMRVVTNLTKSGSIALVRIPLSADEDPVRAQHVLESVLAALSEDPALRPHFLDQPRFVGIEDIGPGQYTVLLRAQTAPAQRFEVARRLRFAALTRLHSEGIRLGPAAATGSGGPASHVA